MRREMKRVLLALALAASMSAVLCAACSAEEQAPAGAGTEGQPKEWQAPVAQVPMRVDGEVVEVSAEQRTFTVMTKPKHRLPPGKVVVGVNRDTQMVKDELCLPEHLRIGDAVVAQGLRPPPLGVALFVHGKVTQVAPLTVEPAKEVKVVIEPGAELSFLRQSELKLEELSPGTEVQAVVWHGDEPVVAKEVHALFVLPGAVRPEAGEGEAPPAAEEVPPPQQ